MPHDDVALLADEVTALELEVELAARRSNLAAGLVPSGMTRSLFDHELAARTNFAEIDRQLDELSSATARRLLEDREAYLELLAADLKGRGDVEAIVRRLLELDGAAGWTDVPGAKPLARESAEAHRGDLGHAAETGMTTVRGEASRQGVRTGPMPRALPAAARTAIELVAERLASGPQVDLVRSLREEALRQGRRVNLDPARLVEVLEEAGGKLSPAGLQDYARTSTSRAYGVGRQAGVDSVPVKPARIYASELLDRNTCPPCYSIDGREYETVEESLEDYPEGGYINCDGGDRCRGTRVFVWEEAPPTARAPGDEPAPPPGAPGGPPLPGFDPPPRGPAPRMPREDDDPPAPPDPPEPDPPPVRPGPPAPAKAKTAKVAEEVAYGHPTLARTPAGRARVYDYGSLDSEVANDLNATYAELFERYPAAAESVQYVGSQAGWKRRTNMRISGTQNALMWAHQGTGTIAVVPKFAKPGTYARVREWLEKMGPAGSGWLSTASQRGTIAHEFGHHVYYVLRGRPDHTQFMDEVAAALGKAIGANPGEVTWVNGYIGLGPRGMELRKRWREGLSKYSGTNNDELIAEVFAEYVTSPDPRPIAREIGKIIDRYIGGAP